MAQSSDRPVLVLIHTPRLSTDFNEEDALRAVSKWFPSVPLAHLGWNGERLNRDYRQQDCIKRVNSNGEARRLVALVSSGDLEAEKPLVIACAEPEITSDLAKHCKGSYVLCVALADEADMGEQRRSLLSRK